MSVRQVEPRRQQKILLGGSHACTGCAGRAMT